MRLVQGLSLCAYTAGRALTSRPRRRALAGLARWWLIERTHMEGLSGALEAVALAVPTALAVAALAEALRVEAGIEAGRPLAGRPCTRLKLLVAVTLAFRLW